MESSGNKLTGEEHDLGKLGQRSAGKIVEIMEQKRKDLVFEHHKLIGCPQQWFEGKTKEGNNETKKDFGKRKSFQNQSFQILQYFYFIFSLYVFIIQYSYRPQHLWSSEFQSLKSTPTIILFVFLLVPNIPINLSL